MSIDSGGIYKFFWIFPAICTIFFFSHDANKACRHIFYADRLVYYLQYAAVISQIYALW